MVSTLSPIFIFGLGVVVDVVVDGGAGAMHLTPAASVLSQSWMPQPSNLQARIITNHSPTTDLPHWSDESLILYYIILAYISLVSSQCHSSTCCPSRLLLESIQTCLHEWQSLLRDIPELCTQSQPHSGPTHHHTLLPTLQHGTPQQCDRMITVD